MREAAGSVSLALLVRTTSRIQLLLASLQMQQLPACYGPGVAFGMTTWVLVTKIFL